MNMVAEMKSLGTQVTTIIDVVCFGETMGRKLWPSEYEIVINHLFKDKETAAKCKAAADAVFEVKLTQMEEEQEHALQFI